MKQNTGKHSKLKQNRAVRQMQSCMLVTGYITFPENIHSAERMRQNYIT